MIQTNFTTEIANPKRPLLQTKLCMPRSRRQFVNRPRLLQKLEQAIDVDGTIRPKLTLITGPAGYGKTTLITQWVQHLSYPIAWLSLDAGENDAARFLAYLFASIGTIHEEIGEVALARLTSTYIYNEPEAILTAFLNDIATIDETILLVLDDYHMLQSDTSHKITLFLLQHMPIQLHLVITSRNEPPLPLALLQAQQAINHVTTQDLRFTIEEASLFLQQTVGATPNPAQLAQLEQQVEGWVTGLQLVTLALQQDVTLQQAFSGNQRYLVDYLAEQVLHKQSDSIQTFLLETAILDQFNASLCQAVTGQAGQPLLEQIEQANLFLIPLDIERNWYRYHHLFAEFLNGRLQRHYDATDIAQLHRRAAYWYAQQAQPLPAVDHALSAGDYELATDLMIQVARQVLMFGEGNTLRQWVESLPSEMQTSRRRLILFYAWALIRTGDLKQAYTLLEQVAPQLDTPLLWGEYSALRARLAAFKGDTELNIAYSNKALTKLPADQHMLRSEVAINLGFLHLQQNDIHAAEAAFAEAAQNTTHDRGLWSTMFATYQWGKIVERQGHLSRAFEIYQQGLKIAETKNHRRELSPAVGFMHIGLGNLLYEWNRLDEAERHLRQALAYAERCGDHKMLIYSQSGLSQVWSILGQYETAVTLIQHPQQTAPTLQQAKLALQQGNWQISQQWAKAYKITSTDNPDKMRNWPSAYLQLIKYHLAKREFDPALQIINKLEQVTETGHHNSFTTQIYLVKALAYAKQGHMNTALSNFHQALALGKTAGFIRTFLDIQDPILNRLLHHAANNDIHHNYACQLLQYLDPQFNITPDIYIQPLTPRELEVLHCIAHGLSNRDIAQQLVVSINTVKAHTRRLYDKLDVNNRLQAVARARELQLLSN